MTVVNLFTTNIILGVNLFAPILIPHGKDCARSHVSGNVSHGRHLAAQNHHRPLHPPQNRQEPAHTGHN